MSVQSNRRSLLDKASVPFWSASERRLRAAWRIAGFVAISAVLLVLLALVPLDLGGRLATPLAEKAALYIAIAGATLLATRLLDRKPLRVLGVRMTRAWWGDLGFGAVLGAAIIAIVFAVELALGWITVGWAAPRGAWSLLRSVLPPLALAVLVGVTEETAYRGYLQRNMAAGLGPRRFGPRTTIVIAWFATSALFGLMHAFQPGTTLVSTLNIVLAGIWLGLAYVATGSLAISIGAHITWNFVQGYVFGFAVSGNLDFATGPVTVAQHGPTLVTGGAFGPEGGLLGLLAFGACTAIVALWIRARHGRLGISTAMLAEGPADDGEPIEDDPSSMLHQ